MQKPLSFRPDPETAAIIAALPGNSTGDKIRAMVRAYADTSHRLAALSASIDRLGDTVAVLASNTVNAQPPQNAATAARDNAGMNNSDLAALFQALALIANAINKPGMAGEAAGYCASMVKDIARRQGR